MVLHLKMSNVAQIVKMIANDFYSNHLDLSERGAEFSDLWSQMPAKKLAEEMRASGKSERAVRLFLTFVSTASTVAATARTRIQADGRLSVELVSTVSFSGVFCFYVP